MIFTQNPYNLAMSSLKKVVQEIWEHIQDSGKDFIQFPKDLEDSVRNSILRQPQTLRNYNITTALNQRELLDTLQWFHNSNIQNIKSWIAEHLLLTMDRKNFPINTHKIENIYWEIITIDDLYGYEWNEIISKIQTLLDPNTKTLTKDAILKRIKEIFKESNDNVLTPTKQKIIKWLLENDPSFADYEETQSDYNIEYRTKAVDDAYEIITNKFTIKIYQLLCHEREKNESQESTLETAKEIFNQAKDFALKQSKEYTLQKLSPQDIFSLQIYNYNSNFWNTHIKDGNNLNDLVLFKPHTPRPPKPNIKRPERPKNQDFEYAEDYERAKQERNVKTRQLKRMPEYKKRNERTEKTERMKDILQVVVDLWPLKKISNWIVKRISAVLDRTVWAWVQRTIETVFRPNILEMSPEEEELLRHILVDVYWGGKKCFIVLNHETFANIPMTIVKFMQVAHEMNMENINEHFTTIIWPLLATHKKQNALLNSLSSILVTHPADNRILWAKRISNHQQQNAWSQFEKDLIEKKENLDSVQKKKEWQIYFCAPSWTRDIVHYSDDWIPQIFIPDASWWSNITTAKLIRGLHAQNPDLRIYAVSTNTTELKRPNQEQWVSPNNNKWNKNATVSMHLKEINAEDLTTENIISTILNGIDYPIPSYKTRRPSRNPIKRRRNKWKQYYDYDENGKINEVPCATPLPTIVFQYLKKFTKTPEYAETWKLPQCFFDEQWKLDLNNEVFKYLQEFSKTGEYSRTRKIPSRFFNDAWYINLELLKSEIENNQIK